MEKMDKTLWQNLYNILDQIHSDFYFAYRDSQNGKNKKIRADADRRVDNAISLAVIHIRKNWEVFELLTGKDSTGFGRAIIFDEFKLPQYFDFDMREFLEKIKQKISSFD